MTSYFLRFNGTSHSFGRELGCTCNRCKTIQYNLTKPTGRLEAFDGWSDPPWRANTSVALMKADEVAPNRVKSLIMIDIGAGVTDSLMSSGLDGLYNVEAVLNTHGEHADHILGQNQFFEGLRRTHTRLGRNFTPVPYYATRVSVDRQRQVSGQDYELTRFTRFREVVDGIPIDVEGTMGVRATPILVTHGWCEGSVIYALEFDGKKVICMWDIDGPDVKHPVTGRTNRQALAVHCSTLKAADVLIISTNTWSATGTGHSSYQQARPYLDIINATTTFCLHASGHEDTSDATGYGWPDDRWTKELAHDNVKFARQGQVLAI